MSDIRVFCSALRGEGHRPCYPCSLSKKVPLPTDLLDLAGGGKLEVGSQPHRYIYSMHLTCRSVDLALPRTRHEEAGRDLYQEVFPALEAKSTREEKQH